jgi:hypothetical protein
LVGGIKSNSKSTQAKFSTDDFFEKIKRTLGEHEKITDDFFYANTLIQK